MRSNEVYKPTNKTGGHIVQGGAAKRDAYVGSYYPPMKTSTI